MSKPVVYHFLVEIEGQFLTFIGGRLIPDGKDHVWITSPTGKKVVRVPRTAVSPSSHKELIKRMINDRLMDQAPNN